LCSVFVAEGRTHSRVHTTGSVVVQVPWTLVMWTMPGVLVGGQIGPYISSKVSSYYGERALIGLFVFLGFVMGGLGIDKSIERWR